MQGVQAGGDLHAFGHVDSVAVSHVHTGLLQRRTAIGEAILHHQILRHLRVDKGRDVGVAAGDDGLHALHAGLGQLVADHVGGTGGDLVDHAPGEGDLRLVLHIGGECGRHMALLHPAADDGQHGGAELLAIVAAVVHGHHGHGIRASLEAGIQHRCHDCHGVAGLVGAFLDIGQHHGQRLTLDIGQGIALLGDGEGRHLHGGTDEAGLQLGPLVGSGGVGAHTLGDGGDDLLLGGAVGLEGHHQGHGIMGIIDLVNDVVVEGLGGDDAALRQTHVQQPLLQPGDKAAEDVARAEMHPHGRFLGGLGHLLPVVFGQGDTGLLIGGPVLNALIGQLHGNDTPFL